MRKLELILISGLLLMVFGCSQGQDNRGLGRGNENMDPEQMAERRANRMSRELNLDDQRTEEIKKIFISFSEKQSKVREEHAGDREAMRTAMKGISDEQDKELQKILTEEEWKKWLDIRKNFRRRRGGN